MLNHILHIASIFLAIQVFLGSLGVPIVHHYCTKTEKHVIHVAQHLACNHCCGTTGHGSVDEVSIATFWLDHSCCTTTSIYEKIDIDFVLTDEFNFYFSTDYAFPSVRKFVAVFQKANLSYIFCDFNLCSPPLLRFGKMMRIFIQVFRC